MIGLQSEWNWISRRWVNLSISLEISFFFCHDVFIIFEYFRSVREILLSGLRQYCFLKNCWRFYKNCPPTYISPTVPPSTGRPPFVSPKLNKIGSPRISLDFIYIYFPSLCWSPGSGHPFGFVTNIYGSIRHWTSCPFHSCRSQINYHREKSATIHASAIARASRHQNLKIIFGNPNKLHHRRTHVFINCNGNEFVVTSELDQGRRWPKMTMTIKSVIKEQQQTKPK